MASKAKTKSVSSNYKSRKGKKTPVKRKKTKTLSKPKIPVIINSEEDIDLILGLPTEALEEKRFRKPKKRKLKIDEKPIDIVEKELEIKKSQILAEIKRQSSDEQQWIKVRDQMKKELRTILEKKKKAVEEINQYKNNNAALLKEIKKTNKDIEKKKSRTVALLSNIEKEETEAEAKTTRLAEKEKAWNEKEINLNDKIKLTNNKEKSLIAKEKELSNKENLINSKMIKLEQKKEHLAELMNLKKNVEKREKILEKKIADLRQQESESQITIDDINKEKTKLERLKQNFLAKEKVFIKQEQMFVGKNKELADKTRDIEKKEKQLEAGISDLEDKKQMLSENIDQIAVKAAMLRAEAKEKRKEIISIDKAWIKRSKELDTKKFEIKKSTVLLNNNIIKIKAAIKQNSGILDNLRQKENDMKKFGPKIKKLTEKYDKLRVTEENLQSERQNLVKIRDDIIESRKLLRDEEQSIVSRVNLLEKDETLLRKRENEVVNKVEKLEENRNILKEEEKKIISKLKEVSEREKAIGESQKNLAKVKRILEIDFTNQGRKLVKLRKEWVSSEDTIKKLGSTIGTEKMIVEDIFEVKDDIINLRNKELEVIKLVRQMEKDQSKLEKTEARTAEKENRLKVHEEYVKAQQKEANRIMKLNINLSDKIASSKSIIKKLPQLKRDILRTQRTYEKEAAKLDKVTTESLAKREILKDFEARLNKKEIQLKQNDESLKRREQLLVNMEYNVLKEKDEVDNMRFNTYMGSELEGLSTQAGEEVEGVDVNKEVSFIMEKEQLPEDQVPKCPENIDLMIQRAQSLVKTLAIEDAERLCEEIEKISKEAQFSSEDLKKIEYSLMEIKTDIKLARLS
ncbi:MAG: hypothetical protein U9R34_02710 [Nanoarchaeota archaeon]|nr:hypothetical protein [Nanoarchaeota archaeon]